MNSRLQQIINTESESLTAQFTVYLKQQGVVGEKDIDVCAHAIYLEGFLRSLFSFKSEYRELQKQQEAIFARLGFHHTYVRKGIRQYDKNHRTHEMRQQ